jgi:hypothetical protein
MLKSKFVYFFAGAVVLVAAGAVAATAAADKVAPAVTKVKEWAKGAPSKATVKGQLRLDGEPMAFARVEFHTPKGVFAALADANGLFEVKGVPPGEARVTVHTVDLPEPPEPPEVKEPKDVQDGEYPEPEPVKLPERYRNSKTSGLNATLEAGEQWQNFHLPAY